MLVTRLLFVLEVYLGCETNLQAIMGWESFDVVRFALGTPFQGQTSIVKLKSAYNSIIISPRGLGCETNP